LITSIYAIHYIQSRLAKNYAASYGHRYLQARFRRGRQILGIVGGSIWLACSSFLWGHRLPLPLSQISPPVHSASVLIPELNTTVKLEFYGVWDEARESGRYLTVSTQTASVRSEIDGFDWVHNPRTSIYETPEHVIAILGPAQTDYFIDPSMIGLKNLSPFASSVGWHYIGAFDFGGASHTLQFIPASQQSECIPMRKSRDEYWPKMSRAEYRQEDCRPR
jgi:hypothetical protein